MLAPTRAIRAGIATLALALALLADASSALPALAAGTTPFQATFAEQTTFVACPPGTPPDSAICFRGEGTGAATPGGPATETFRGVVVLAAADPVSHCVPDYNAVTISTKSGRLYLVTQGMQCPPVPGDRGRWTALGGTGSFDGARGGGTVVTTDVVMSASGATSTSTYVGTLTTARDRGGDRDR